MRIGFLVKDLKVNGANRMILELAGGLARIGWQVTLLVQDAPRDPWLHPQLTIADIALSACESFDVIISTYYPLVPILDAGNPRLRAQLIMDNYYRHGQKSVVRRDLLEYAYLHTRSLKIVVSHYLKELLRHKQVDCEVLHVGIDHDLFYEDPDWRDGSFRVLVEGYPRIYKALPETYAAIPAQYSVWGLGIEDHGERAGRMWVQPDQPDLRRIYSACSVLVKLERQGGFPQAPLEAMACGTPVICSDEGGHMDYCIDGFNALIAQHPDDVARHLAALHDDAALLQQLRVRGKETARIFTWPRACARLAELLCCSLGET